MEWGGGSKRNGRELQAACVAALTVGVSCPRGHSSADVPRTLTLEGSHADAGADQTRSVAALVSGAGGCEPQPTSDLYLYYTFASSPALIPFLYLRT